MRVLMVEDEPRLAENVARSLRESAGYAVDIASDGQEGLFLAESNAYDLMLLDLMLPKIDGMELLRRIRQAGQHTPVLVMTARDDKESVVALLNAGADDYLTKPFAPRELLARIRSVLRRAEMLPRNLAASEKARLLRFGEWKLDTAGRFLVDADETVVSLSGAEYRLLRVFLDHPQHVLNRDQLLDLTQGREAEVFDRSIDLLVSRLRQRLRDDAREPSYIKTVRSEGYEIGRAHV